MKIYDCFTFFNELDLLEIRLETLYKHVDYFVLVEMNTTFSGIEKQFIFQKNKKKFSKYLDKIIHIKISNPPKINPVYNIKNPLAQIIYKNEIFRKITQATGSARWKLEIFQRNQIKKALENCSNNDIIMISDVDEIPNPKKFPEMKKKLKEGILRVGFEQDLYLYYLNGSTNIKWLGPKSCYYKTLKEKFKESPQKVRINRKFILFWDKDKEIYRIKNGGWHFSWIGGAENVQKKLKSYAHIEESTKYSSNLTRIKKLINRGRFMAHNVKISYTHNLTNLPKIVKEHQKQWIHLFKKPKQYSLAIIILNWNGGKMLKECLDSIKNNTPKIYKLFIVDNGSNDNSINLIKKHKNIYLIKNKENKGFVTGNNQAIEIAFKDNPDLDYILLLNNDTKVTKNWLGPLIETIEQDKKIGIVGPKQLDYNGKKVNAAGNIKIISNEYYTGKELKEVDWIMGACMLIKAEVIEKIGGFDEIYSPAYYEETDFLTRAKLAGFKTYYCGRSLIYHKGGASANQDSKKFNQIFYRNRIIYFIKYKPLSLLPRIIKDISKSIKEKNILTLLVGYQQGLKLIIFNKK